MDRMARFTVAMGAAGLLAAGWLAGSACGGTAAAGGGAGSATGGEAEAITVKCDTKGQDFTYAVHEFKGRTWQDLAASVVVLRPDQSTDTIGGIEYHQGPLGQRGGAGDLYTSDGRVAVPCEATWAAVTLVVR